MIRAVFQSLQQSSRASLKTDLEARGSEGFAMAQMLNFEDGMRPYAVAEIIDARELARRWQVLAS